MGFLHFTFTDIIDILVIGIIIYYFLRFIKGTRALQMMAGLIMIFFLAFIADFLNLQGFSWIMSGLKTAWIVAFVILFQPEIRNALASLGKTRFIRAFIREGEDIVVEIANGAIELSEKGIGGLIVIEREMGLKNYIDTGIPLDAKLKSDLISTIFTPYSPLHDGAVIIRGNTIVAAACILPLSDSPNLPHTMGTRHRAALGIAEETDAVSIVISEETRRISIAVDRELRTNITRENLKEELKKLLL
ncbi:TIGR00159 family protein [candidate division WOR-3 bacterium JGI_Cruoil_03_44_89]|uniref:Diadenylate cyclase n=1 Tax=candidate division WOR-3 bacterium JGI_Cruoil_03_44_89 TaxID=1973748 RepID=A0A235BQZ7_UNCW3|nr:MAG: TIGR00159 family protein [candidate division WOR-3 bacterium JGI_Cruoil_03_44_89]